MPEDVELGTVKVPIEAGLAEVRVSAQTGQVTIQGTLFGRTYAAHIDTVSAHALTRLLYRACLHAGRVSDRPLPGDRSGGSS